MTKACLRYLHYTAMLCFSFNLARMCEHVMRTFDFDWPENLECSKFPESGGDQICVAQNTTNAAPTATNAVGTKLGIPHTRRPNGFVGPHRNMRFVCPVQLKTPPGLGYSLHIGGEVSNFFFLS